MDLRQQTEQLVHHPTAIISQIQTLTKQIHTVLQQGGVKSTEYQGLIVGVS